jgi:hypothetical protein
VNNLTLGKLTIIEVLFGTAIYTCISLQFTKFEQKGPIFSENWRKSPKVAENRRKSTKIDENRRKSTKIAENRRKSPKIDENRRKSTKIAENRQKSPKIDAQSSLFQQLLLNATAKLIFSEVRARLVFLQVCVESGGQC